MGVREDIQVLWWRESERDWWAVEERKPLVTGSVVSCVDRLWIVLGLSR